MGKYGLRFPLLYNKADSFVQYSDINDYFKFCVKLLFLTSPGEKVNDLQYGVGLRDFLFQSKRIVFDQTIGQRIKQQIERTFDFVTINDIQVKEDEEDGNNVIYVRVFYSIPKFNVEDFVFVRIVGGK